jgi:hypothetical protein
LANARVTVEYLPVDGAVEEDAARKAQGLGLVGFNDIVDERYE